MEAEKRRWGRKEEATGGMTAVCGRGICHILSGDGTSERYSIACAVLGSCKHTSTLHIRQQAQPSLSGSPRLRGLHAAQL